MEEHTQCAQDRIQNKNKETSQQKSEYSNIHGKSIRNQAFISIYRNYTELKPQSSFKKNVYFDNQNT